MVQSVTKKTMRRRYDFCYDFTAGARIVPKNCPLDRKEKRASSISCTISWQRGGGVKLGSVAAAPSLTAWWRCLAWQRACTATRMAAPAATNAVLPLRAATVAMKTPAATAMVGAQTIKNVKRYLINHLISTMLSGQCFVFLFR